jgi:aspartate beta-hydroxylase
MVQALILDPSTSVPEHEGPYLGYLRYHPGLRAPKNNPPKIVVNGQDYIWKESEAVMFDDSWPHEVINNSNELRAMLIVDVLRPVPFTGSIVNRFVANVVGRYFYGRPVARKAEAFAKGAPPEKLAIA